MTDRPEFKSLREKIAWEKAQREERYAAFADLLAAAHAAGRAAHDAVRPTPMVVEEHENQFDDSSPVVQRYVSNEGPVGFAWVIVRPGNSSFAHFLRKTGRGSSAYRGGVQIWVRTPEQSYERKVAYARAMADVLKASPLLEGLSITTGSRVD